MATITQAPNRNAAAGTALIACAPSATGLVVACAMAMITACAAAEPSGPAEAPKPPGSSTLAPGVVVAPALDRVYVMRPGGGVEALDLDHGGVRWTSSAADQPLFVAGGVLAARVDSGGPGLVVALLDVSSGEPAADEPIVLPLPAGVAPGVDQTLERSFVHSVLESNGEVYLNWEYIERDVTGVSPPGGRPFARRESGAFRFADGKFEATATEPKAASEDWPAELRERDATRQVAGPPWRTGGILAIAQQRYDSDQLVLRRWRERDGKPLKDRVLHSGRAVAVLGSCDQRHVAFAVASGLQSPEPPYVLHYHDLGTGERVAQVPSERSVGPFCLSGDRLLRLSQPALRRVGDALVQTPLELVATGRRSGAEVWRRVVRDIAFRGPAPPRN